MTKQSRKPRPAFLKKPFGEPYSFTARINVGSFLDKYKLEHGRYHEPRFVLPRFLEYLGKKQS